MLGKFAFVLASFDADGGVDEEAMGWDGVCVMIQVVHGQLVKSKGRDPL